MGFPWRKKLLNCDELMEKLKNIDPKISHDKYKIYNFISKTNNFHNTFRGKYYIIKDTNSDYSNYNNVNLIEDCYTEKPRVKSIGYRETISPYEYWIRNKKIIKSICKNDIYCMREYIYTHINEARLNIPTVYTHIYKLFKPKNVLDIACAWGARMLAAIATDVYRYIGIDPNIDLIKGYKKILNKYNKSHYKFIPLPFEQVDLKNRKFDLIIMSPPPFIGEVYSNPLGQSTNTFTTFDDWFENFLIYSCVKAYNSLNKNGHIILTILDIPKQKYILTERLLLEILKRCTHLKYEGVIGFEIYQKSSIVPFWVFKHH